jgi:hypothetical protein
MGILNDALEKQLREVDAPTRERIIAAFGNQLKRGWFTGKSATRSASRYMAKVMLYRMVATARTGELGRLKSLIASLEALDQKLSGARKS